MRLRSTAAGHAATSVSASLVPAAGAAQLRLPVCTVQGTSVCGRRRASLLQSEMGSKSRGPQEVACPCSVLIVQRVIKRVQWILVASPPSSVVASSDWPSSQHSSPVAIAALF